MKILVTGASGLIGSEVVQKLYNLGYEVCGLFRRKEKRNQNLPYKAVYVDLFKDNIINRLERINISNIVHCAAVVPKTFFSKDSEEAAKINKIIDTKLLEYCIKKRLRILYMSSTSLYNDSKDIWFDEKSKTSPNDLYKKEKYKSEKKLFKDLNKKSTIFRISSPYGPKQKTNTVLKIFIERAIKDLDLIIYGNGLRKQDFISVYDIADAVVCSLLKAEVYGIFNVVYGIPINMYELGKLVIKLVPNCKSRLVLEPLYDEENTKKACFSNDKAKDILDWEPKVSIEDGIRNWVEYLTS